MRARSIALLALLALGCGKKSEPPPPLPTAAGATATASAPTPAPTPITAGGESDAVPTEEDFEDEAERGITAENLEAELDKLEREIGQ